MLPFSHMHQALPLHTGKHHVRSNSVGFIVVLVQNVYNPEWYIAEYDMIKQDTAERVRACGHYTDTVQSAPGYTADLHGNNGKPPFL